MAGRGFRELSQRSQQCFVAAPPLTKACDGQQQPNSQDMLDRLSHPWPGGETGPLVSAPPSLFRARVSLTAYSGLYLRGGVLGYKSPVQRPERFIPHVCMHQGSQSLQLCAHNSGFLDIVDVWTLHYSEL